MFAGDCSSVMNKLFGEPLERNSETTPESVMSSPTFTDARIVLDVVKMLRPLETRTSVLGSPWIQKPDVDCEDKAQCMVSDGCGCTRSRGLETYLGYAAGADSLQ